MTKKAPRIPNELGRLKPYNQEIFSRFESCENRFLLGAVDYVLAHKASVPTTHAHDAPRRPIRIARAHATAEAEGTPITDYIGEWQSRSPRRRLSNKMSTPQGWRQAPSQRSEL